MSSTNFRSILIFAQAALLVLVIYSMGELLLGGVLFFIHYYILGFIVSAHRLTKIILLTLIATL